MKCKFPVMVINYGMGNVSSVLNMLRFIGVETQIAMLPDEIRGAETLILPGVGSFDAGVRALQTRGLDTAIREAVDNGASILGICLGMQLLMESSEEGKLPGLALVPGKVKRFYFTDRSLRIPHMGWNEVQPTRPSMLFNPDVKEQRFYFVHSYHVECDDPKDVTGITHYGYNFTSSLERNRVSGVQFHPEKSHRFGMTLFRQFLGV